MDYREFLELNKEEMIIALRNTVRINSEEGEKIMGKDGEIYPFGSGVQECFEAVLKLGAELGFETENIDNYGGHIDFLGTGRPIYDEEGNIKAYEKPEILGIVGHLDVVPAGKDWDFEPYGGEIIEGKICGRGTTDDKGPVISCLYAMKALKDSGYKPERTIRLVLGLDEETSWKGMYYYLDRVERPTLGFTPDANFPIVNGEKGFLIFDFARKFNKGVIPKGLELRSVKGGTVPNAVPQGARAVVRSNKAEHYDEIKEKAAIYRERTGYKVNVKGVGKSLEISATGIAAHGAHPELGLNAISILMEFLGELNFVNEDHNDFIDFYNKYIGFAIGGEKLGIDCADEKSGKLIFNTGMVEIDSEAGKYTVNIRYPVSETEHGIFMKMEDVLTRYNLGVVKHKAHEPIYMDVDNPIVKELVDIYRAHTGDTISQPMVIGVGTYARALPGIIAYGAAFPGDADCMHQRNESISIKRLEEMTEIYAEAIYKLSQGRYNV